MNAKKKQKQKKQVKSESIKRLFWKII